MSKLNIFSRGLNIKNSPYLLEENEATIYNNIDNSFGSLKPIKANTILSNSFGTNSSFIYFNGQWVNKSATTSYVIFNNKLYYSDSVGEVQKSTNGIYFYNLGIANTNSKVTTAIYDTNESIVIANKIVSDTSDIPTGTYTYMFVYYSVLDAGIAYTTKTEEFQYTSNYGITFTVNTTSSMSAVDVYRLYEGNYKLVSHLSKDGSEFTGEDIIFALTDKAYYSTPVFDTIPIRQYCYTYYNDADGAESAPTEYSDEILTIGTILVSNIVASTDPQVTNIRLYRIGGDLTSMTLVDTLSNTSQQYHDTKTDIEIASNDILITVGSTKPPTGLSHLTEYNATLFGAKDSVLWFSETGLPDLWNEFYQIPFTDTIMGLGSTQNGLLVFLRNATYIIVGTSSANLSRYLLNDSQGCISHKTIKYVNNSLVWLSLDGLCTSQGSTIEVITESKLGKLNIDAIDASVYENQYYLFHEDGTIVMDTRNSSLCFKTLDLVCRGSYYSSQFDKLYILNTSGFLEEFATGSSYLEYNYKSGWLTEGSLSVIKNYSTIYIFTSGEVTFKFYVDGLLAGTYELVSGFNQIKIPASTPKGYYSEIEFIGTGFVYEIEFKVEGRQNGR